MSINWWMDKEDMIYIYNGILLGNEKEWNPAICSNMAGTGRYYAEWNKSVREGQIVYVFTHVDLEKLNRKTWGKERGKNSYKYFPKILHTEYIGLIILCQNDGHLIDSLCRCTSNSAYLYYCSIIHSLSLNQQKNACSITSKLIKTMCSVIILFLR